MFSLIFYALFSLLLGAATTDTSPSLKHLTAFDGESRVDFADPSAPDFSEPDSVRVYTTGGTVLVWKTRGGRLAIDRFLSGEAPRLEKLKIYHNDGITPFNEIIAGEDPWDPSVQTLPGETVPTLFAGVMSRQEGEPFAYWPEDHWSRRTFAFTKIEDRWVMSKNSVFGPVPSKPTWIGHNYGHHFITDKNQAWMFYEKVTAQKNGHPTKTEIFCRQIKNLKLTGPEIPIYKISSKPWPSVLRRDGTALAEGPRPFQVGEYFLLSFSGGDYDSDHYGIHLLWSKNLTGPYRPILNSKKTDLFDFGRAIEKTLPLRWGAGRAVFFKAKNKWWTLFHGVPEETPVNEEGDRRRIYLAPVSIKNVNGESPQVKISPGVRVR